MTVTGINPKYAIESNQLAGLRQFFPIKKG